VRVLADLPRDEECIVCRGNEEGELVACTVGGDCVNGRTAKWHRCCLPIAPGDGEAIVCSKHEQVYLSRPRDRRVDYVVVDTGERSQPRTPQTRTPQQSPQQPTQPQRQYRPLPEPPAQPDSPAVLPTRDEPKGQRWQAERARLLAVATEAGFAQQEVEALIGLEASLFSMVGMKELKDHLRRLFNSLLFDKRRAEGQPGLPCVAGNRNLVLLGNPGTGKTTAVRALYKALKAAGVLSGEYVAPSIADLRSNVKKMIHDANDGLLFIDEAYQLTNSKSANGELVREVDPDGGLPIVVVAGYRDRMLRWLSQSNPSGNPGLERRFPTRVELSDYTAAELCEIAMHKLEQQEVRIADDASVSLLSACNCIAASNGENAGGVQRIIDSAIDSYKSRVIAANADPNMPIVLHSHDLQKAIDSWQRNKGLASSPHRQQHLPLGRPSPPSVQQQQLRASPPQVAAPPPQPVGQQPQLGALLQQPVGQQLQPAAPQPQPVDPQPQPVALVPQPVVPVQPQQLGQQPQPDVLPLQPTAPQPQHVDLQPQHLVGQPSFVMPEQVDPSLGYLTLYNTGTCHLALSTWHLALSTWHLAPDTWHLSRFVSALSLQYNPGAFAIEAMTDGREMQRCLNCNKVFGFGEDNQPYFNEANRRFNLRKNHKKSHCTHPDSKCMQKTLVRQRRVSL